MWSVLATWWRGALAARQDAALASPPAPYEHGCGYCQATPAQLDDLRFAHARWLFDRSHEAYRLRACPRCGQVYLEQFHEIVNWRGGNDDSWTYWVPLTPDEVALVDRLFPDDESTCRGGQLTSREHLLVLYDLMHRRRRLTCDWERRFYWSDIPWAAGDALPPG
jgi:hypothetical protein